MRRKKRSGPNPRFASNEMCMNVGKRDVILAVNL